MKLVFNVHDKPKFGQMIVFAIQQLLAIMAATIAVPAIVGNGMTASAALFGAGAGTIIYQLFTIDFSSVFFLSYSVCVFTIHEGKITQDDRTADQTAGRWHHYHKLRMSCTMI